MYASALASPTDFAKGSAMDKLMHHAPSGFRFIDLIVVVAINVAVLLLVAPMLLGCKRGTSPSERRTEATSGRDSKSGPQVNTPATVGFVGPLAAARSVQCKSNMRNVGIAIFTYAANNNSVLPYVEQVNIREPRPPCRSTIKLLPYLDADALLAQPYKTAAGTNIPILTCPSDPSNGQQASNGLAMCNYPLSMAIFHGSRNIRLTALQVMESPSQTIICGERFQFNGTNAQTQWADLENSMFQVPGVDKMSGAPSTGRPNRQA